MGDFIVTVLLSALVERVSHADLQKVLKFPQMGIFWLRNFCQKNRKLNLRLITTIIQFFGNQMKYHHYGVSFVEKLVHSLKTSILSGNEIESFLLWFCKISTK